MDQGRIVKKMFESKPEGSGKMGRPRLRWLEDVQKDLQEMKVKYGDKEWTSLVKEAKALRRP